MTAVVYLGNLEKALFDPSFNQILFGVGVIERYELRVMLSVFDGHETFVGTDLIREYTERCLSSVLIRQRLNVGQLVRMGLRWLLE